MATDVTMPQLGESVTEGTITRWLKKPGDRIAKYEPLCEVATDKVNAEVPATISGTLLEVVAEEGATVEVGQLICRIEEEGSTPSPQPENQGKDSAASSAAAPAGQGDQSMKRRYSPAVLRLAQEHGIDLEKIEGTGKGGGSPGRMSSDISKAEKQALPLPPIRNGSGKSPPRRLETGGSGDSNSRR